VSFYYFWDVVLPKAKVPSPFGLCPVVDDDVRPVLAQAEAVHGVYTDLAEEVPGTQLVLKGLFRVLRAPLLAVSAGADEDVRLVVPNLCPSLWLLRRGAVGSPLLELLFLGDGRLRIRLRPW
jgi:hypothetical protein